MIKLVDIHVCKETKKAMLDLLDKGELASGPTVVNFEKAFAEKMQAPYSVACANGTAALHSLWMVNRISKGTKILTSPFTFIASSNSILFQDAIPVFGDIDLPTYNLDPNYAEDLIKKDSKLRTILLIHLYGLPCDIEAFRSLQKKYDLQIFEDCAQAHGASYLGKPVGSWFDGAAFSFYATKNIACGEGGMVTLKNEVQHHLAKKLINHGRMNQYEHDCLGYNYRMSSLHAVLGLDSLQRNEAETEQRIQNARYLIDHLPENLIKPFTPDGYRHVFHQFVVRSKNRDALQKHLFKHGVQSNVVYPLPNYKQPYYQEAYPEFKDLCLPKTEQACSEVLSLPVQPHLTQAELEKIQEATHRFFESK